MRTPSATPETMIILSDDRRLDLLIDLMGDAMIKAKRNMDEESWEVHYEAWCALHDELMRQLNKGAKDLAVDADK